MPKDLEIQATYVSDQPILSILESNLDLERVSVRRTPVAVKAVLPIELIIQVASIYLLEKLLLDPLINPLAEKFDWVKATKKHLRPHQPFNLVIRLEDQEFIQAPLNTDHDLVADVWHVIADSIALLRDAGELADTNQIRIVSDASGDAKVIAYRGAKPALSIDTIRQSIIEITDSAHP